MSRSYSGPICVIDGPTAVVIARYLDLDELRRKVRGKRDDVYSGLLAVATTATEYAAQQQVCPPPGRFVDGLPAGRLSVDQVRVRSGRPARSVRRAAQMGHLEGSKNEAGEWEFTPAAVEAWLLVRAR